MTDCQIAAGGFNSGGGEGIAGGLEGAFRKSVSKARISVTPKVCDPMTKGKKSPRMTANIRVKRTKRVYQNYAH